MKSFEEELESVKLRCADGQYERDIRRIRELLSELEASEHSSARPPRRSIVPLASIEMDGPYHCIGFSSACPRENVEENQWI